MYTCPHCAKSIGLMLNGKGEPQMYKCPNTGLVADAQMPIRGKTKPRKPPVEDELMSR